MSISLMQVSIIGIGICWGAGVYAADIAPGVPQSEMVESESGWTYTVAPYFWAAGLSGDMKQFGLPSVHINSNFNDIWDDLDFAFMGAGEARYDRFSIFGDVLYTKLGAGANTRDGTWRIASM